jgi:NAD(P)-dependent dehydrogenase (short-subunit alcohol dehydrogenase family)
LRQSEAARVIHMTTSLAREPKAFWGLYAATKAGAEAMMLSWADEIENTRIRVCVLDPGRMRTQMRAQAFPGEDPETLTHPSEIAPLIVELARGDVTPPGRVSFKDWKAALPPEALI